MVKKVKPKYALGDNVEIIHNYSYHHFNIGEIVEVTRVDGDNDYEGKSLSRPDECWYFGNAEIKLVNNKSNNIMQLMKDAVELTAKQLLKANNTVTTLEIKTELRKSQPHFYWTQATVSQYMDQLATAGTFTFTDNGTFRVYSDPAAKKTRGTKSPAPKAAVKTGGKAARPAKVQNVITGHNVQAISRTKALDLIRGNKGHFFTAVFIKKDGTERTINCQYAKDQTASALGYIQVKEAGRLKTNANDATRQINLQTLKSLRIGGLNYKIRK